MRPVPIFLPTVLMALLLSNPLSVYSADPFAEMVRKTEPLPPLEQQATFKLPPGFEITLVASEPQIAKPMNLAFDLRGRLWVTDSREYPYPAPPDRKGRDSIKLLVDHDGDGRADRVTTFAEGLNIPIGLIPFRRGVIAYSIPNLIYYEDTDGDDRADRQEILLGPYGYEKDTHGMTSGFRQGFDGWIYACHGFNNTTTLRGRDGSSITMTSGNTYRFRSDGSRVEQHTWGQVNPFGLAFDPLGNLYSADCHTLPVYQLLRGAFYPSFGRPHDGLGFGPVMMQHLHGSTAIGGIVFCSGQNFPSEFRNNVLVGNVMTSRINRDVLEDHGSTRLAREQPDFLTSQDPWFRPVDLQFAPDGSLYVADFYNRIIGHYEVPLDHPGRDRERGRIWRIKYRGDAPQKESPPRDWTRASLKELILGLGSENHLLSLQLLNHLADEKGSSSNQFKKLWSQSRSEQTRAAGLWILERWRKLTEKDLTLASGEGRLVRTHLMRLLGERSALGPKERGILLRALKDRDGFVQRCAAEALGRHPNAGSVEPLVELIRDAPAVDTHLHHSARIALRNQLLVPGGFAVTENFNGTHRSILANVAVGVTNAEAASFLLNHLEQTASEPRQSEFLRHSARFCRPEDLERLVGRARATLAGDLDQQVQMITALRQGVAERGGNVPAVLTNWGVELAGNLLQKTEQSLKGWKHFSAEESQAIRAPWILQPRDSADGKKGTVYLSSLPPGGEALTGILRSSEFKAPPRLSFYLAGHDGPPGKEAQKKNRVRLVSAVSNEILAEAQPPRSDIGQKIDLDLGKWEGQRVALEVVDGDTGESYAWLAISRFDPPVLELPSPAHFELAKSWQSAAELAGEYPQATLQPELARMVGNRTLDLAVRSAAATSLARYGLSATNELVPVLFDGRETTAIREKAAESLSTLGLSAAPFLLEALRQAPYRLQNRIAEAMAGRAQTAEPLLASMEGGKITARILADRRVREKLAASPVRQARERVEKLSRSVPGNDEARTRWMEERLADFRKMPGKSEEGAKVFAQNCAACHQVKGQGSLIGPQLDGVGSRGVDRLVEDIADPNRNVDEAFRYVTFSLKDGSVLAGLPRREEGDLVVVADASGQEKRIPRQEIEAREVTVLSLMPENFHELLTPPAFRDLLSFLLEQRPTAP